MDSFTPLEYLKIAIANAYGLDKEVWNKRIQWTDDNINQLESMEADEPYLYLGAVRALRKVQRKEATGFIMGLDASASGMSIMSVLMNDPIGAIHSNLIDSGDRQDLYTYLNTNMGANIERSRIKEATIPFFYNSTNAPRRVFNKEELELFYYYMKQAAPGVHEAMGWMNYPIQKDKLEYRWTLPDGYKAIVKVMEPVNAKIEIDYFGSSFTHRALINKPKKVDLSLPANITQSVDAYIARQMVRMSHQQGFDMIHIFDCFYASPVDIDNMRFNYNSIMADIANSTLLQDIIRELTKEDIYIKPMSDGIASHILQANYSLT